MNEKENLIKELNELKEKKKKKKNEEVIQKMNERFKKDCEDYEQKLNAIIKEKESDKKNMKS